MDNVMLIGHTGMVPTHIMGKGVAALGLDMTDSHCLRFEVDGLGFVVSHAGLTELLEVYAERMRMLSGVCPGCDLHTGPQPLAIHPD